MATSVGTSLWRRRGRRKTRDAEADPGVEAAEARNQAISFQNVLIALTDEIGRQENGALSTPGRSASTALPIPESGRSWWAHFEFTRINIEPFILRTKILFRAYAGS